MCAVERLSTAITLVSLKRYLSNDVLCNPVVAIRDFVISNVHYSDGNKICKRCPSSCIQAVQQVVSNLQIGHIELRSEESVDTQRYVNERSVDKIVVPLEGEILELTRSFAEVGFCDMLCSMCICNSDSHLMISLNIMEFISRS